MSLDNLQNRLQERLQNRLAEPEAKNETDSEKTYEPTNCEDIGIIGIESDGDYGREKTKQSFRDERKSSKTFAVRRFVRSLKAPTAKIQVRTVPQLTNEKPPFSQFVGLFELKRTRMRPPTHAPTHAPAHGARNPTNLRTAKTLKPSRCSLCSKFSENNGTFFCRDYIGGTGTVYMTGEHVCQPAPDADHWCAGFIGARV